MNWKWKEERAQLLSFDQKLLLEYVGNKTIVQWSPALCYQLKTIYIPAEKLHPMILRNNANTKITKVPQKTIPIK